MYIRPIRGGPAFYIALHACCIPLKTGAPVLCPPFIAIPSPLSEFGGGRTRGVSHSRLHRCIAGVQESPLLTVRCHGVAQLRRPTDEMVDVLIVKEICDFDSCIKQAGNSQFLDFDRKMTETDADRNLSGTSSFAR